MVTLKLRRLGRTLRAQGRDAYVLFREFRLSLLLFIGLLACGTLIFWLFYVHPDTHERLSLNRSFYAAFSLVFFQTGNIPYPDDALLIDLLYYLMPIIGLGIIGDSLVRFGVQIFNKEMRKEEWQMALASTYRRHVIVCGAGHVGYRVIEQLARMGEEVIAIESNRANRFLDRVRDELRVPLLIADATQIETLKQAGIEQAQAIIPCTSNDLLNLEIALNARELNPTIRIILRMFDAEMAQKIGKGFGFGTAFSTAALAAPAFAAAVHQQDIQQAVYVDDVLVALSPMDIRAGSPLIGKTLGQIEQELDVNLVLHKREHKVDHRPDHNIQLKEHDHIIIFGTLTGLERAKKLNGT
jgi:Trk K+ transport system NAD-binding subunit